MKNLKYSIIYALIRPEISEKISIGLITLINGKVEIRYSQQKLNALKSLLREKEHKFLSRMVKYMKKQETLKTEADIEYLHRYSNNLLAVSPLQTMDLEPTSQNKEKLYKTYVYRSPKTYEV